MKIKKKLEDGRIVMLEGVTDDDAWLLEKLGCVHDGDEDDDKGLGSECWMLKPYRCIDDCSDYKILKENLSKECLRFFDVILENCELIDNRPEDFDWDMIDDAYDQLPDSDTPAFDVSIPTRFMNIFKDDDEKRRFDEYALQAVLWYDSFEETDCLIDATKYINDMYPKAVRKIIKLGTEGTDLSEKKVYGLSR